MLIWNCYDCICSYLNVSWRRKIIYMHVCFLNISEKKLVHILNCRYFSGCTPWKENWYFFVCILEKKIRNNSVPYLRVPHFLISHFQVGNIIQLKKNNKKNFIPLTALTKKKKKREIGLFNWWGDENLIWSSPRRRGEIDFYSYSSHFLNNEFRSS